MGDRAYVHITCRREDAERFGQLGFVEDGAEGDIAVSMPEFYSRTLIPPAVAREEAGRSASIYQTLGRCPG
ncbi:MAG: hypothetical protein HYS04_11955 [Acidobacteria bacterium]|nr:hypothetical protein [Acidobacteriota bacterium]